MSLGKVAYDAYCEVRGWKSVRGEPLPPFDGQSPELQEAWEKAAAVVKDVVLTTPEGAVPDPNLQTPQVKTDIRMLEMEEYLLAKHAAEYSLRVDDTAKSTYELRSVLWTHRFFVFTWLLMNGVQLQANLVSDNTNVRPGNQSVDKPA